MKPPAEGEEAPIELKDWTGAPDEDDAPPSGPKTGKGNESNSEGTEGPDPELPPLPEATGGAEARNRPPPWRRHRLRLRKWPYGSETTHRVRPRRTP